MAWKINQQTGIGTNTETGQTMPIQAPNPNVNPDGTPRSPITQGEGIYSNPLYSPPTGGRTPAPVPTTPTAPQKVGVDENIPALTGLDDASRDRIINFINTNFANLTETERSFLISTFVNNDTYTSGQTVPTNEQIGQWISDAATLAGEDINPYYTRISGEELADYRRSMEDIRAKSQTFQAGAESTYKQKLAEVKRTLRARGLTFGGTAIKNIGAEAAVQNVREGTLQEARRLDYEASQQALGREAAGISTLAERRLGSEVISGALSNVGRLSAPADLSGLSRPLYTPTGQYRGTGAMAPTIVQERARDIDLSKQSRLQRYRLTI